MIKLKLVTGIGALALSTLTFANPALSADESAQRYSIEIQLFDGDSLIAEPRLVTAAGEAAVISINGSKRLDYYIEIIPSPKNANSTSVALDAKISKPGWSNRLTTTILLDNQSLVHIGDQEMVKSTMDGFSMNLKVNPVG